MRFLGIDFGTKKIGIALSDKSAKFAFPHSIIKFTTSQVVNLKIKEICEANNVEKIIIGRPIGYKGDAKDILGKIEKFKLELEKEIGSPVVYENEVLTTKQAERPYKADRPRGKISNYRGSNYRGSNYRGSTSIVRGIDASAAALILQSWLDKKQSDIMM